MSSNWLFDIRHVLAGEAVRADVVNRPTQALEDRTNYLRNRLDAAELGRALFDADATIAEDVKEGEAVFWNFATQRYERALAGATNNEVAQTLVPIPSANCIGMLYKKTGANIGDVVLSGIVKFPIAALNDAVVGNPPSAPISGRYFLSTEMPGKLVRNKPAVGVDVCYVQGARDSCDASPWVVVAPQLRDFSENHTHYRYDLSTTPAGTAIVDGGICVFTSTNDALMGWLPANHPAFWTDPTNSATSYAPQGAVFGYNINAHDSLRRVWPPIPLQAVSVLWDKGVNLTGATEVPLGPSGLVICDNRGIWWMSNCVNDLPFTLTPQASSSSAQLVPECPRDEIMRVSVVFLRMLFGNNRNVVTSLIAAPGSPITVQSCCGGSNTKTGDLQVGLNLSLAVQPPNVAGGVVLKQISEQNRFRQGWVTEGIVSGSDALVVTGHVTDSSQRELTPAEKTALGFDPTQTKYAHRGLVKIDYQDSLIERELSPQIIRLSDVVERLYRDVPYLGFVRGQESLVRVRFVVPASGLGTNITMRLRAQLLGLATGTLPNLVITYRRLPRPLVPRPGGQPPMIPLVSADETAPLSFETGVTITANNVVELKTAAFAVAEGDTVLVTIKRLDGDSYLGEIGLLRLSGVIAVGGA